MNTLGHAVGEREGVGAGWHGRGTSWYWLGKEVNARWGGGGSKYFTFLGSFCAATHIIDKACSIAVIETNQCHSEGEKNISHAIPL